MIDTRTLRPIIVVLKNTPSDNLKFHKQMKLFVEVKEQSPIDKTLIKRAEYFNFLSERGLL